MSISRSSLSLGLSIVLQVWSMDYKQLSVIDASLASVRFPFVPRPSTTSRPSRDPSDGLLFEAFGIRLSNPKISGGT
jgi:hypothetical protein